MFERHTGIMARRLLVNWRVPPRAAQRALPPGVRPHLVHGHAVVGLCLVRLEKLRPARLPPLFGLASENVAVRMGVEIDTRAGPEKAVLIFHRDTNSWVNFLCAPRVGFGRQHRVRISVRQEKDRTQITMSSPAHSFDVAVQPAEELSKASVFGALEEAANYFRGSEKGYSPAPAGLGWHAAKLQLFTWKLAPMRILHARSTFIERMFGGTASVDSAFVMRNIPHAWTAIRPVTFESPPALRRLHAA
jgi:hypothetical protein